MKTKQNPETVELKLTQGEAELIVMLLNAVAYLIKGNLPAAISFVRSASTGHLPGKDNDGPFYTLLVKMSPITKSIIKRAEEAEKKYKETGICDCDECRKERN